MSGTKLTTWVKYDINSYWEERISSTIVLRAEVLELVSDESPIDRYSTKVYTLGPLEIVENIDIGDQE